MFIAQLLKLLFFAALAYLVVTVVRQVLRSSGSTNGRTGERRRENVREDGPATRKGKGTIELDKDQYRVE